MTKTMSSLENRIVEYAYVVEDIDAAIPIFTAQNIGPWFVNGPYVSPFGQYRGEPNRASQRFAFAFDGDTIIELIQIHNDEPSVFREITGGAKTGFHHWARFEKDYDAAKAALEEQGFPLIYEDKLGTSRIAEFDSLAKLPGVLQVIELTPEMQGFAEMMWAAAQTWDGSDPIRPIGPPPE
jgi:hypothetical protein